MTHRPLSDTSPPDLQLVHDDLQVVVPAVPHARSAPATEPATEPAAHELVADPSHGAGPSVADPSAGSSAVGPTALDAPPARPRAARASAAGVAARWRRHSRPRMPMAMLAGDLVAFFAAVAYVSEVSRRILVMGALALLLFRVGGLYRNRLTPSVLDDFPALVGRALVAGAVVTGLGAFDDGSAGRVTLMSAMVFAVLLLPTRGLVYAGMRHARRRGWVEHRTLLLGGGEVSGYLARTLLEHREIGLRPVGFLDDDPLLGVDRRPVPHLGGYGDLVDVILDERIHNVVVGFGSLPEHKVVDLLRDCDRLACEIFVVPRLYELHGMSGDMEMVWGTPLGRLRRAPFRTPAWRAKRALDVVLSGLALLVLAPVLGACALAVRLTIGPAVLFRQERVGLDGRPFTLLKFTSLLPKDENESAQRWNVSDDDRLTPVGRFLRRTSLDELPQFWNVLRGDMSLVGPRPERPFFVATFRQKFPRYMARHRVPAGLTGAAQVAGLRGDTSIEERARFDNYYIENWSLWEDVKLIVRTVQQVVGGRGR